MNGYQSFHPKRILIEKADEYNYPLWFDDYKKPFSHIVLWAVVEALIKSKVDFKFKLLFSSIYKHAIMTMRLEEDAETYSNIYKIILSHPRRHI